MKHISIGRIVAFVLAVIAVFFAWGYVFPVNGTHANVILGIFLALLAIYYITRDVGDYFDASWFHKGFKGRGERMLAAIKKQREWHEKLKPIFKKPKKYPTELERINKAKQSLHDLRNLIWQLRHTKPHDTSQANKDIAQLQQALENVEQQCNPLLNLRKSFWTNPVVQIVYIVTIAILLRTFLAEPFQIPSGSLLPTVRIGDHIFVSKISYGIPNPFNSDAPYLYRWAMPQVGDVIVFQAPAHVGMHAGKPWIKRVVATAGQKVKIRNNIVYTDNKPYEHDAEKSWVNFWDYYGFGDADSGWKEQKAEMTYETIGNVRHAIYMNNQSEAPILSMDWPNGMLPRQKEGLICNFEDCQVKPGYVLVLGDNRGASNDGRVWGALDINRIKGKAKFIWMSVDGSKPLVHVGNFSLPGFRLERIFQWII